MTKSNRNLIREHCASFTHWGQIIFSRKKKVFFYRNKNSKANSPRKKITKIISHSRSKYLKKKSQYENQKTSNENENKFHGIFFPEYFSNDWKFDLTKSYFSMAIDAKG